MECDVRKLQIMTWYTVAAVVGILFFQYFWVACPAAGQEATSAADVREGRDLAIRVCANCHVAAPDQPFKPILRPPAPSLASIAQRKNISTEWVENYLKTTHSGLDKPKGMPNPQLLDKQVKQVSAYLLSLRKK